jgi:hypothetical protein
MTMWKRPVVLASIDSPLHLCSSLTLFCSMVAISLGLVLFGSSSVANARTAKSGTVIACFHEEISRFTPQAHPSRCTFRGFRGKRVVEIPIRGMTWGHWGANPTRAAYGVDRRDGTRVRIIAHRPIICNEGRIWYSQVVVLSLVDGNAFVLRLPTCDDPSVVG